MEPCNAKFVSLPLLSAALSIRFAVLLVLARMFERRLDRRRALQPCGYWKFSGAQEIRVEQLRLITCATVSKDSDDCAAWTEILGQTHCPRHVNATGAAETEPLMLEQIEDIRHRLGVGNEIGLIDVDISDDGCNATKANAFGDRTALGWFSLSTGEKIVHRGAARVGDADDDVLLLLTQIAGDTRNRPASTDGTNKAVDPPFGLPPNLRSCRNVVRLAIVQVVSLIGEEDAVGFSLSQVLGKAPA